MPGWREAVEAVLDAPGVVVVLGPPDVGKTTAATALANAAVRAGRPPAIVDTDTGQSDIGPPTTVGLGMVDRPVRRMIQVPLRAAYFVGDISPQPAYGLLIDGTVRLIGRAQDLGAAIVVVDTTGWVEGPAAVHAKLRKIGRIGPRHVIAIQRAQEVEPILARLPQTVAVHRLPPAAQARRRSSRERRAFREQQFARYFHDPRAVTFDLAALRQERSVSCAGRRIPAARVVAEAPPRELHHRLVGLAGEAGELVVLGTLVGARPDAREVTVVAPRRALEGVRVLQWGALRVSPAGREEGRAA